MDNSIIIINIFRVPQICKKRCLVGFSIFKFQEKFICLIGCFSNALLGLVSLSSFFIFFCWVYILLTMSGMYCFSNGFFVKCMCPICVLQLRVLRSTFYSHHIHHFLSLMEFLQRRTLGLTIGSWVHTNLHTTRYKFYNYNLSYSITYSLYILLIL